MLFLITQSHTPEHCPIASGGLTELYDADAKGVKVIAAYGALSNHVLYYFVEAKDDDALEQFLIPGFQRTCATITPVRQFLGA